MPAGYVRFRTSRHPVAVGGGSWVVPGGRCHVYRTIHVGTRAG